jgi:WhiB family redox-sensing transcriptional regulator
MATLTFEAVEWMTRAACRGTNPALFYPEPGGQGGKTVAEARRLCRRCPVKAECLEYVLGRETRGGKGHRHGVWGGLTGAQRYQLVRCRAGTCRHTSPDQCRRGVRR